MSHLTAATDLVIDVAASHSSGSDLLQGIGVSPGVAIAEAHCLFDVPICPTGHELDEIQRLEELARFEQACHTAIGQLHAITEKVGSQIGPDQGVIFEIQAAILRDVGLTEQIRRLIAEEQLDARSAVNSALAGYETSFSKIQDEYLRERLADVRDVLRRVSRILSSDAASEVVLDGRPIILVANELFPSDVATIVDQNIVGIVTRTGSRTSHAAILAHSYGLPAVSGVEDILDRVRTGDTIIVDGRQGHIFVRPHSEVVSAYQKLKREYVTLNAELAQQRDQPAVTCDGIAVELLANVNCLADVEAARESGAEGIGLYRTEYLFLTHPNVPDENEQTDVYREIIGASPGSIVTIRTLDLGGDKTIPYLEGHREANPFMGWRSIRLSFEHPDFFLRQIRAVLRAAADQSKEIRLLFPMITAYDELCRVRRLLVRAQRELDAEQIPRGNVSIGLMIEVPSAAVFVGQLIRLVDFVSIGSNDLVQYLTAADRDNPKVVHLCEPLSPAVLMVLNAVIGTCLLAEKPISLCGEMASLPRGYLLLLGMGLRSFSISPAWIPAIKSLTTHVRTSDAERILVKSMTMRTAGRIIRYVDSELQQICPDVAMLQTV